MLISVITTHFASNGSCRVFLLLPLASYRSGSRKCNAYISEALLKRISNAARRQALATGAFPASANGIEVDVMFS